MSLASAMNAFLTAHPLRALSVAGARWEYLTAGSSDEVVLILHGGTGSAQSVFPWVEALERDYRVIAPTVPASVEKVDDALAGVEAILDAEHVRTAHCIGLSMGGMLLQVLIRRRPERARSLVLFHCPPPGKAYAEALERRTKRAQSLPGWLARPLIRRHLARQFALYPSASKEERDFWLEWYLGASRGERMTSQLRLVLDYLRGQTFSPRDLWGWPGRVLIFETATDEVIPAVERERLKALYPTAQVHTFATGSHLGNGIFERSATLARVKRFLAEAASPPQAVPPPERAPPAEHAPPAARAPQ